MVKTIQKSSGKASTMAQLLEAHKSPFVTLRKAETIIGRITKLTPSEILVDINAKTEAVVLEKDKRFLRNILSTLKVGDEVSVYVLSPESDRGNPVVSLRKFMDDLSWKRLADFKENKKELEVLVTDVTRGGFLITTNDGLSGFLPNSQVLPSLNPQEIVGKKIKAFILELNRKDHKIIFSQKTLLGVEDFEKAIKNLKIKIEQKISAVIENVTPFAIFVTIQNSDGESLEGIIHISEISWEKVENIADLFSVGQVLEALVIGIDKESRRIELSLKRLTKDPFEEIAKGFTIDQKVSGRIFRVLPSGVILKLNSPSGGGEIEGFIRREKIPPTVSYKTGEEINVTISQIDPKRHRIVVAPVLTVKPIGYR